MESVKKDTLAELTEKIRAEIKQDNQDLVNTYQNQLGTYNENYSQQIVSLNESINAQNNNINEIINTKELLLKGLISSGCRGAHNEPFL